MQNIYIFFYAQECWTFISLKNTKIKFKKDTHNPEYSLKGICWTGAERLREWGGGEGGNLSLLQSESPGSTANDQSTASHCSVEGTGRSESGPEYQ